MMAGCVWTLSSDSFDSETGETGETRVYLEINSVDHGEVEAVIADKEKILIKVVDDDEFRYPLFFKCFKRENSFSSLFDEKDLASPESFINKLKKIEEREEQDQDEEGEESEEQDQDEEGEESEEQDQDEEGDRNLVRKKRRRPAGEISGRQMALKKLKKEGWEEGCRSGQEWPPPLLSTVKDMRKVLEEFSEGEEYHFTEDQASALRIFFSRQFDVSGKDGSNSILTNYYKLALLPQSVHRMAVNLMEKYERGELCPPASANQRQRKSLSSSSFNFLRGLNPQKKEHQEEIRQKLKEWLDSKTRPREISRKAEDCETANAAKGAGVLKERVNELQATKKKLEASVALLEKKNNLEAEKNTKLQDAIKEKDKFIKSQAQQISLLLKENSTLKEELNVLKNTGKVKSKTSNQRPKQSPLHQLSLQHHEAAAELQELRKRQKVAVKGKEEPEKRSEGETVEKKHKQSPSESNQSSISASHPKIKATKKYKGYAYVPEGQFKEKNIFGTSIPTTRLRKR